MRARALFREAGRDIVSGTTKLAILTAVFATMLAALICSDALSIAQLIRSANDFRAAGATTYYVTADDRINPTACENLRWTEGVSAAGALRATADRVTVAPLPDSPIPLHEMSPGFAGVLGAESREPRGVIVSRELSETLGTSPGDVVESSHGELRIATVFDYPSDGRRPGFAYSVLSASNAPLAFDECWITVWPQLTNLRSLLLSTVLPSADGVSATQPQISQLNPTLGASFAGDAAFFSRITRANPAVSVLVGFSLGFLSVRIRRLHIASALHAGVRRRDVVAIHTLEASAWSLAGGSVAVGIALGATRLVPDFDQRALLASLIGVPLAGLAGVLVGAGASTLMAREKHLFRFFKDR
jgi:hypothetical protein